ncbi:MAG: ATP-binding protein [Promethearchaeota archaeon]
MSQYNFEEWTWTLLIRFSYLLLIILLCLSLSIYFVLKHSRFSGGSLKEKFEAILIYTLIFTVGSSFLLYFLKYFIFQRLILTSPSISLNTGDSLENNFVFFMIVIFILLSVFGVLLFSEYEFHSVGSGSIIFRRSVPLPYFLRKLTWLFDILSFLLFGDRYLVINAIEITRLPREIIRREQRPIILQENFQSTGARKYEYEDISAYLKKCRQGAQELSIGDNGIVKVRRYVFGTSRRLHKAIEVAQSALIRMRGGLESLSFEIDYETVSERGLRKITLLPEIKGYGSEKSVLQVKRTFLEEFSYDQRYVSIIFMEGFPEHKAYGELTQHDRFIRHCLNLQVEVRFVTNFKNTKIKKEKLEEITKEAETESLNNNNMRTVLIEDQKRQEASDYAAGLRSGITKVSAYVLISAKDEEVCKRSVLDIENSLNTIYSGTHYCVKTSILRGRKLKKAYKRTGLRLSVGKEIEMSVFRLSPFTHLPEKPILGIESDYIPEFEIPVEATDVKEGIEIGHVVRGEKVLQPLKLKVEDLRRSMTVLGLIGSGKTCLTKNLVLELSRKAPHVNWIVFDYKSEYKQLLSKIPTNVRSDSLVFAPGSEYAPLKINIFDPCGFSPEEHADRVFSLIREVYSTMFQQDIDLSVQMERVLKDVLDDYIADPTARIKGFEGFLQALDNYAVTHKNKFSFLEKTVTALHNRLEKFTRGALKEIFDVDKSNVSFDDLLHKKVFVDIGYMQSRRVPKDDIRFLMNFLVRLYGDYAIKRGLQQRLRNLIIVEECQFLVPELYRKQTSIDATPTEDLSILLRAYGIGFVFVGTRPLFAENSLANSYTIISFQLTKDAEQLQKYMNLDERQVNYLKRMRRQECLVFSPTLRYPTRVRVNDFKDDDFIEDDIRIRNSLPHTNLQIL